MESRARGGADVAVGDSALSQIDNPATLGLLSRCRQEFDVAGQVALPECRWERLVDSADSQVDAIALGNLGLSIPLDERLTLGLALHSKAGLGTRYSIRHLMIPFMDRRVGGDLKVLDPQVNVAWKVTDKLCIGAGVRAKAATCEFSPALGPADLDFGHGSKTGTDTSQRGLFVVVVDGWLGASPRF